MISRSSRWDSPFLDLSLEAWLCPLPLCLLPQGVISVLSHYMDHRHIGWDIPMLCIYYSGRKLFREPLSGLISKVTKPALEQILRDIVVVSTRQSPPVHLFYKWVSGLHLLSPLIFILVYRGGLSSRTLQVCPSYAQSLYSLLRLEESGRTYRNVVKFFLCVHL